MNNIIAIPAHLDSKRFPNKAIAEIDGLPLIVKTYRNCLKSKLVDKVICAISDEKLLIDICKEFNIDYHITGKHISGTSRCNDIPSLFRSNTYIINCQVDYPKIIPETFDNVFNALRTSFTDGIHSCYYVTECVTELAKRDNVKVDIDKASKALFFSRLAISNKIHIGLYGYNSSLMTTLKVLKYIEYDSLEQYTWLFNNIVIRMHQSPVTVSINSPADLDSL